VLCVGRYSRFVYNAPLCVCVCELLVYRVHSPPKDYNTYYYYHYNYYCIIIVRALHTRNYIHRSAILYYEALACIVQYNSIKIIYTNYDVGAELRVSFTYINTWIIQPCTVHSIYIHILYISTVYTIYTT